MIEDAMTEPNQAWPDCSIIVPAHNEEHYLPKCLAALLDQDYQGKFEIIVVDNNSADSTAAIAKHFGVKLVREKRTGVTYALLAGVSAADGKILTFTDADTIVPKDWLTLIAQKFLADSKLVALGGPYSFYDGGKILNLVTGFVRRIYETYLLKRAVALPNANLAILRSAYQSVGGFDPDFGWGQDIDISRRLKKIGKVIYDPTLFVETSARRLTRSHNNFWIKAFFTIREIVSQGNRFWQVNFRNKTYQMPGPIRTKADTKLRGPFAIALIVVIVAAGIGFVEIFTPASQLLGHTITRSPLRGNYVALTFDDGPYGQATTQILDILKQKHVQATFFVVGQNALKYPEILKREIADGHTIGNHSLNHSQLLAFEAPSKALANINAGEDDIYQVTGLKPRFYRPPYGLRNPFMIHALQRNGYTVVMWTDATLDYEKFIPAKVVADDILRQARPGAIIDLHDGRDVQINYPRGNLIKALPLIIDGLRHKDYSLVTVNELLGIAPYR